MSTWSIVVLLLSILIVILAIAFVIVARLWYREHKKEQQGSLQ